VLRTGRGASTEVSALAVSLAGGLPAMPADLWFRGSLFLWRFTTGDWQQTQV